MRWVVLAGVFLAMGSVAAAEEAFVPRPITEVEKEAIRQAVKKKLKDPGSALFRWNPALSDKFEYCGFVNSKNSFGGYVGFSPFKVFIDGGSILLVDVVEGNNEIIDDVILRRCKEAGYNLGELYR